MARRKISIDEAFAVLQAAGINVQVKPVEVVELVEQQVDSVQAPIKRKGQIFPVHSTKGNTNQQPKQTKVTLFCKHTVGNGGYQIKDETGVQTVQQGVVTYGPGVCMVPAELVEHLLYQDSLARKADERMLEKTQRSYLIVRKINSNGNTVDVGVQVDNDIFNEGLSGNISNLANYMRGD
jgi:hypothetical protein